MRISYNNELNLYYATITFSQRDLLKKKGWRWNSALNKWTTPDRNKVEDFKAFMDESARKQEEIWHEKSGKHIELSKKLEFTEDEKNKLDFKVPVGERYDGYQEVAIHYAQNRSSVLLADPPGLGKTVEAIGIVNNAIIPVNRVLIVCEASHKIHWERMWQKWCINPDLKAAQAGTVKEKYKDSEGKTKYKSVKFWPDTPVIITNYHQLKNFHKEIRDVNWDYLITDESHNLGNPEADRTKEIFGFLKKKGGSWRWEVTPILRKRELHLSGTPLLGKPKKMFVFFRAADPNGVGKNYIKFADRYCSGHMTNFGYNDNGASNLEEFQAKARSLFMIRRSKTEALKDLPPKRRYPIILPKDGLVKLIEKENNAYNNVIGAFTQYQIKLGLIEEKPDRSNEVLSNLYEEIQEKFGDLDRISFKDIVEKYSPDVAAAFEEAAVARRELAIAKLPMVAKFSQEIIDNGDKLILFCIHTDVASAMRDMWPECAFITGKVPANKRQAEVDRFQDDPDCMVAVGNLHAMGKGYTMNVSQYVDFAELHWVFDDILQAEDRAWRRGQKNAVTSRHFVVEDTMDARFVEVMLEKEKINEEGLDTY